MKHSRNILICPLEWGLGHAGRMIALAQKLQEKGNNIFIGAGEQHLSLFRREMTGPGYIDFPGFKPGYSRYIPQYLKLLFDIPVLLYHIICEHRKLERLVKEYNIDMVISDNRFGLWNKDIVSVYVTHMPRIPFPAPFRFMEFLGVFLHRAIIRKYSLCFIPDLPGELNLSGRLSHKMTLPSNVRYIGILSRFSGVETAKTNSPVLTRHNTVILSGPEPQKEMLKEILSGILRDNAFLTIFLGGKPEAEGDKIESANMIYYDHLTAEKMKGIIATSEHIIARSGYTSIMELVDTGCSALLIPTPGQTEQEYLAEYLENRGWFKSVRQKELNSRTIFPSVSSQWPGEIRQQSEKLLEKAIGELLTF